MAERKRSTDEASVAGDGATLDEADLEEIVALLRSAWPAPDALGQGGPPCRSGLDRFTVEDPAFRSYGR